MTVMETAHGNDLIEVVMRLPRQAVEQTLLSAAPPSGDLQQRRLDAAKAVMTSRRRRAAHLRGVYFKDPSWDMILELYVALREERPLAVSQLCELSGASMTTALRHLENLEARGYVLREPDPTDRRRLIVAVLPLLSAAFETWLDLQVLACQTATVT